ncbi:MAG: YciI family protein [Pseudomonadota bacterium]
MFVALTAHDKPGALPIRQENRPAHLDYIKSSALVAQAGPLLDGEGAMIGSLIILDVEEMAQAETFAANDPYAKAGLFASVTLQHWNRVIG